MAEPSEFMPKRELNSLALSRMNLIQRSRYLAYQKPSKEIAEAQDAAKSRNRTLSTIEKQQLSSLPSKSEIKILEEKASLYGQLKSAEAKNRIDNIRLTAKLGRDTETNKIILFQTTSLRAFLLSQFLECSQKKKQSVSNSLAGRSLSLNDIEMDRCISIIEDKHGITYRREIA